MNQHLETGHEYNAGKNHGYFRFCDRIECVDGFSLSVQASAAHYCTPRTNEGPWTAVEVGYPSASPELILEFAEDSENPTGTVYPFVPIGLVEQLIALHGGVAQ